ncbi:FAD-dependent oxidoreductase [Acetomicrobium hydrogeniformans]|uniref:Pyridine nucleotide-disulfide oxidoreductase n=1 Tax=Acetomicrobium hydrogeniformans ATCC BAA-1850 TaxID=592015 RepID=A0A0T5X8R4_9BACT|nr:FAD-dependent oxidoreductase [Acetomicrobium hydrogeniformans]KRT34807.1 pyridine nucleotide-disulfide oxidoreductase [Acetomicrobium hydrogeniformans ATCC BAA-1850]
MTEKIKVKQYPPDVIEKMKEIVEECMGDAPPFCQAACPMHTDAKGYIQMISEGKYKDAIKLIREKLFLPGTLGRICAHPCEERCKRGDLKYPMSIAELKRFASQFDNPSDWDLHCEQDKGKSVAIIGGGPAGAQAAIDLKKKGYSVTIFEKLPKAGGMLQVGIPEYRLPREIVDFEYSYLYKLGIEIRTGTEVGKDISFNDIKDNYDAILIATGATKSLILPIPGNDLNGVLGALELLKDVSEKKPVEVGNKAVVIGGGNVAMDAARTLLRVGAKEVQLFCLEQRHEMPAHTWEVEEAEDEGVIVNNGYGPKEILGKNGKVKAIRFKKCLSVFDAEGKFNPSYDENDIIEIDADSIIFAVGQRPDTSFIPTEIGLELEKNGRIKVLPETLETNIPGIFAAGDVVIKPWFVIEALALGRKAAISIDRYLEGKDLFADRDLTWEGPFDTWLEKDIEGEEILPRVQTRMRPSQERINDFKEVNLGFTEEMARREAERCLQCECRLCMQECLMLNDFAHCPRELFEEILKSNEVNPLVPYSCNMCDQCTLQCPKEFKLGDRFSDIRKELVQEGLAPLKEHKPILAHQRLGFSKLFNVTVPDTNTGKTVRVFFPGCSLPSYNPEAVGAIYAYLKEKLPGTGAILKCCGKPTKALGMMEDFHHKFDSVIEEIEKLGATEVIVACQSCYNTFRQYLPEHISVKSLWQLLPEIGLPDDAVGIGKDTGITVAIHDSCVTRDVPSIHDGIRWIVKQLGYEIEELSHSRENTRCCGYGGMIVPVNPDLAKRVMSRRAQEANSDCIVTYCAACRASMMAGGKQGFHILDLIFGGSLAGREAPAPDGSLASWYKRWKTKRLLKKVAETQSRKSSLSSNNARAA